MKKTFISLLILTTVLLITGCSTDSDFNDKTTFVTFSGSNGSYTVTDGGTYSFSGTLNDGKISVESQDNVTLILSGVEIANSNDEAIKIESSGTTVIKIANGTENSLTGGGDAVINAKNSIIFEGSGTLNINGTQKHGIKCDKDITVKNGTINIDTYEHGIKSESKITILGGTLNIHSQTGKGIKAEKEFLGENGSVTIITDVDEGLESKGALTINGGSYDITAGEDGINAGTSDTTNVEVSSENETEQATLENENAIPEGGKGTGAVPPEGAQPDRFRPEGRIPMDGEGEQTNIDEKNTNIPKRGERPVMEGEFSGKPQFDIPPDATYSGTGLPMGGKGSKGGFGKINEDSVLTINGGTIKINCLGDGIDSNGSLTINGGTVIIDGPENSGNGPLDSDGLMLITGGTVLTASARGMTQLPKSMSQGILNVPFETSLNSGDEIVIMDKDDKRICEVLIFTSPDIIPNDEFRIYVNGAEYVALRASMSDDIRIPKNDELPPHMLLSIPQE